MDVIEERKILVLFGSETGTAEEVADGLTRDAIRRHFSFELCSLDLFDIVGVTFCLVIT